MLLKKQKLVISGMNGGVVKIKIPANVLFAGIRTVPSLFW